MALKSVKFLGLGARNPDGKSMVIGGPTGPLDLSPEKTTALAVFALEGWDYEGAEVVEDERIGHKISHLMEVVGNAGADDKYTAEEVAQLLIVLDPNIRAQAEKIHFQDIVTTGQQVANALSDDGKVTISEGAVILNHLIQTFHLGGDIGSLVGNVVEKVSGIIPRR